jgi:hypothetical protein
MTVETLDIFLNDGWEEWHYVGVFDDFEEVDEFFNLKGRAPDFETNSLTELNNYLKNNGLPKLKKRIGGGYFYVQDDTIRLYMTDVVLPNTEGTYSVLVVYKVKKYRLDASSEFLGYGIYCYVTRKQER